MINFMILLASPAAYGVPSLHNCSGRPRNDCGSMIVGVWQSFPKEREQPFALAGACERSCRSYTLNKRPHLRKRGRQRTMCGAAGTGQSRSCRTRWSDPVAVRKCVRGPEQIHRARRSTAAGGAGPSASPAPLLTTLSSSTGEHKKGAGTVTGSRPIGRSELVEHRAVHRVHHPARQMRR